MGLFDFLRSKKATPPPIPTITVPESSFDDVMAALDRIDTTDYLGKAAVAGDKAKKALQAGDFDKAWKLYHEQKQHYAGHAKRSEFTPAQALALDGSVGESLANVLRLEGKHEEALAHLIYCLATASRPSKSQEKKLGAYLNRAKLESVTIGDILELTNRMRKRPDFRAIQIAIANWQRSA